MATLHPTTRRKNTELNHLISSLSPARSHEHRGPRQAAEAADTLVDRAKSEPLTDGGLRTSELLSKALGIDPLHHEAQVLRERLHQVCVPRWHFPMLADAARNSAYARAIRAKVRPGDVVLDIGCGAGLTSMIAARAGAAHVYACEHQPLIARAAERVIADNGLADRITIIPKLSHDIVIGKDMPEPADVVISEIVDTVLLGEGALATLSHAMTTLAKPDARTVPERGRLTAQLVESERLVQEWRPRTAEGFDLSAFHQFASVAQITPSDFATWGLRPLGPKSDLFRFDFANPDTRPAQVTTDLGCTDRGTIHAVLVGFEMDLAPGITLTNGLDAGGHWGRTAILLDRPCPGRNGDHVTITAQHDASQLSVFVHDTPRARSPATAARTPMLEPVF